MLCELALAEAPEGSDEQVRASQSLEATQRLNGLVLGVSKLIRNDGSGHVRGILDRTCAVFARRFDRYDVEVQVETGDIDEVVPPAAVELAIFNLVIAAIARFTTERKRQAFSLSLRGARPSPTLEPRRCHIELELDAVAEHGGRERLALSERHLSRVEDLVAVDGSVTFEYTEGIGRVSFEASEV